MSLYAHFGHKDFILCLGYKGEKIKEYFKDTQKLKISGVLKNKVFHDNKDWNIEFVHSGENANKAQRLFKAKEMIKDDTFLLSYGDDLCDVNINKVIDFHQKNNKIVTLVAVPLISSFGIIEVNEKHEVVKFKEKPRLSHLMNGGFYVVNKKIFDYIKKGYDLEKETFEELTKQNQIAAFEHDGFWKSMNTLKDVIELNELYKKGNPPWIK